MSYTIHTELQNPEMLEGLSKRLREPRELMLNVGVYGMGRAVDRLDTVLSQDADAFRSGRLGASLTVGSGGGGGTGETVFELSDMRVEFGSNLPYAAQVQHGGTIYPRDAKALAIPLHDKLKRFGLGPRELDPTGDLLRFQPYAGGNVFALLMLDEPALGLPEGPAYALAWSVTQEARPYNYLDDEDARVIEDELIQQWLGLD